MPKAYLAALLSMLCLTVSSSYPKAVAASRLPLPNASAPDRRSSPVFKSLIGQWTPNSGNTHYLAADQMTVINLLGSALNTRQDSRQDVKAGRSAQGLHRQTAQAMKFQGLSGNETRQVVRLKQDTPLNWLQSMTLRLAPNRSVTDLLNIARHELRSDRTDRGRQKP